MNPFSVLRHGTNSAMCSTPLSPRFKAVSICKSVDLAKSDCSGRTFVILHASIR